MLRQAGSREICSCFGGLTVPRRPFATERLRARRILRGKKNAACGPAVRGQERTRPAPPAAGGTFHCHYTMKVSKRVAMCTGFHQTATLWRRSGDARRRRLTAGAWPGRVTPHPFALLRAGRLPNVGDRLAPGCRAAIGTEGTLPLGAARDPLVTLSGSCGQLSARRQGKSPC